LPDYGEVKSFLAARLEQAIAAGVGRERIWLDPGIGFGKDLEHNLALLRHLDELRELGRPLFVGISRKSFIGRNDGSAVDDRLGGRIGSALAAALGGADLLRVHGVPEVRRALDVFAAIIETS
jgi:dihydropteroate synthase